MAGSLDQSIHAHGGHAVTRRHGPDPDAPFGPGVSPFLERAHAPVFAEHVIRDLPVEGDIPLDLNGIYLRNGPNQQVKPIKAYHWFDGDGMIHAAYFERGKVTYRNRWLRTDAFAAEAAAGEARFYSVIESNKDNAHRPIKDSANTDLVVHGGKGLALWYLAGDPYEFDPLTLDTLGKADFSVRAGLKVSAHAKVDETTDELMFFDYEAHHPYMTYGVVGADGRLKHATPIELPGPRLPHDMGMTARHSILHDLPLYQDMEAWRSGRHKLVFNPDLPSRFAVLPRYGDAASIRWFEAEPCFMYHVVNCWDEPDAVVMIGCRYGMATSTGDMAKQVASLAMDAKLYKWRFDLKTGRTSEGPIERAMNLEFPTAPAALAGRRTRYSYCVTMVEDPVPRFSGIVKHDLESGAFQSWSDGHGVYYSEPWFAPADTSAAEDDGYVVCFAYDAPRASSEIHVFDAREIGRGPRCRITIPARVPAGFHAKWVRASQVKPR
jgi:carotenoid cleavage dioxygenase